MPGLIEHINSLETPLLLTVFNLDKTGGSVNIGEKIGAGVVNSAGELAGTGLELDTIKNIADKLGKESFALDGVNGVKPIKFESNAADADATVPVKLEVEQGEQPQPEGEQGIGAEGEQGIGETPGANGGRRRRKSNKKPKSRRGGRRVRRKSNKRRR